MTISPRLSDTPPQARSSVMQRIRDCYSVPAKRGLHVKFCGDDMVIVGTTRDGSLRLRARCISTGNIWTLHPTWEIEYPVVP